LIRQAINVSRPAGTLVISQYCSGAPMDVNGNFDPSNSFAPSGTPPFPVPNTLCSLTLSGPRTDRLMNDPITTSGRSVQDAVTNGTTTVTSATIGFVANDVNQMVNGDGIPAGTRIASVTNGTTAVLTNAATSTLPAGQFTIVGSTVNFGAVVGTSITPSATSTFGPGDVNNEIEGLMIPGGSHITGVVNATAVDISQPTDGTSAGGFTAREWLEAPVAAKLITNGPQRGQFFDATGELRQVMIVDTRTADTGWTAVGQVSSFTNGTNTFSGDTLGWQPLPIHAFSQPFTFPGGSYSMSPANGGIIQPDTLPGLSTGTTASTDTTVPGSVPGATLAFAGPGHGLGLAQVDANLHVQIPIVEAPGNYSATLTLTAI